MLRAFTDHPSAQVEVVSLVMIQPSRAISHFNREVMHERCHSSVLAYRTRRENRWKRMTYSYSQVIFCDRSQLQITQRWSNL